MNISTSKRLTEVFKAAHEIDIHDESKIILFSDCHRGDNSWSDDFANNQNLLFHALNYYFDREFIYIEVGDGEELWEFNRFEDSREAYSNIYWKMSEFHNENRLYLVWGNHNRKWNSQKNVEK